MSHDPVEHNMQSSPVYIANCYEHVHGRVLDAQKGRTHLVEYLWNAKLFRYAVHDQLTMGLPVQEVCLLEVCA